jgi:uncharacterized protein YbjQ (UPF0145 family)
MTPEQYALASQAEISAGRLPLSAQSRIAGQRASDTFTSALSVDEFVAMRSVGFVPVGQVMGSAVYNIGWNFGGCGYTYRGGAVFSSFGGPAPVADMPNLRHLLKQARHRAIERMRQECAGLGGDGVVGVTLSLGSFYGNGLEFMAIGTAVKAIGAASLKKPFTSDLSGQDFAKLVHGGWLPVALVMGVGATIRHDDWALRRQQRSWQNQEMVGPTDLVHMARASARESLLTEARHYGGHTVVVRDISLNVAEVRCAYGGDDAHDHIADAFIWGTTIVPFASDHSGSAAPHPSGPGTVAGRPETPRPVTILRLR